ncbi:MAG: hypothetical protein CMJ18_27310 [Phycisphaeraceae bacterium]|nr:hypothetical protein [Phycisphaeraceae bacterium]
MYTLIRTLPVRELLLGQLPVLAAALVVAELFYKFHSFLLESMAFMLTWYVLDLTVTRLRRGVVADRVQADL